MDTQEDITIICFTYQDALKKNQRALNDALIALDRFVSGNPENLLDRDATFRGLRQQVKRLQLERNELLEQEKALALFKPNSDSSTQLKDQPVSRMMKLSNKWITLPFWATTPMEKER